MAKGVLHEILCVEQDLEKIHNKMIGETSALFIKKIDHFVGRHRKLELFDENAPEHAPERKELVTTVPEKLKYLSSHIEKYLDAVLQKELTNQQAKSDLVVDGCEIGKNLPATFLLGLETKLRTIRILYTEIPTLPPGIEWEKDQMSGDYVYKTKHNAEKFKTETIVEPVVLYPHKIENGKALPAQIKEMSKTVNVGKYIETTYSGCISSAEKSKILDRIDVLIQEVKKARIRANQQPINDGKIGKKIMDFINNIVISS